jgi:hypothetical protein
VLSKLVNLMVGFALRRISALELGSPSCRSTRGLKLLNREKRYSRKSIAPARGTG